MRAGASVRTHHRITLPEIAAQRDLKGVVAVIASILQDEVTAGQIVRRVVNEVVRTPTLHEFRFHEQRCGKFFFQSHAPIEKSRRLKVLAIDRKRGKNWSWSGYNRAAEIRWLAGRVEKVIFAFSSVGSRDQDEVGRVVHQSHAGRKLGVAGVIDYICAGETRRNEWLAHDFVPVKTQAGFDENAIAELPAIFDVSAAFKIIGRRIVASEKY